MNMSIFRRGRVVVLSQSNRSCDIGFSCCQRRLEFQLNDLWSDVYSGTTASERNADNPVEVTVVAHIKSHQIHV